MLRLPDGAVGAVQPQHLHQVVGELALGLHRVVAEKEAVVGLLLFPDGVDHRHQLFPDGGEEPVQIGHVHAPLILTQQGVVGDLVRVVVAGELLIEGHQPLQHRLEGGEVVVLLGLVPHVAGLVGELGVGHVLVGGDALELAVVPAQLLHLAALELRQFFGVLVQKVQQLAHRRVGQQLVLLPRQHPQGHAAALGGVPGGHGDAVQIQTGGSTLIGVKFGLERGELLQGLAEFHSVPLFFG